MIGFGWLRRPALQIYCDGSAHERPARPGGWAFVIVEDEAILHSDSGGHKSTNNNTMELHAALAALRSVLEHRWHVGHTVELRSDSRLVIDIALGVPPPRVHADEGGQLHRLCLEVKARPRWVKGHSGNRWNEHVDTMAHDAKQTFVPVRFRKART